MTTELVLEPGTTLPALHVGPFRLTDFVRWAAYQENWLRIHYDRTYARDHLHLMDCIQSGHFRTALIARMITDWLGDDGRLKRFAVRHTAPVSVGDLIRCEGRIRATPTRRAGETTVDLDIWAVKQDSQLVSEGTAVVEIYAQG
ncbi:MAG: MaoC/PaaZ C-terminal domain-containing protein [bacterium]